VSYFESNWRLQSHARLIHLTIANDADVRAQLAKAKIHQMSLDAVTAITRATIKAHLLMTVDRFVNNIQVGRPPI